MQQQFRQADADGDGKVTLAEFHEYYQSVAVSRARLELRAQLGLPAESEPLSMLFMSTGLLRLPAQVAAPADRAKGR